MYVHKYVNICMYTYIHIHIYIYIYIYSCVYFTHANTYIRSYDAWSCMYVCIYTQVTGWLCLHAFVHDMCLISACMYVWKYVHVNSPLFSAQVWKSEDYASATAISEDYASATAVIGMVFGAWCMHAWMYVCMYLYVCIHVCIHLCSCILCLYPHVCSCALCIYLCVFV
jgi:hypothetical protein